MSWQATLLRTLLRHGFKNRLRPEAPVSALRANVRNLERLMPAPPPDVRQEPVRAGGVPGVWFQAPGARQERALLYLHGGGYVSGSVALYRDLAWRLSEASGARVLLLDYRLAPEHPFPAALEDASAAWRWLLETGPGPSALGLAGDSAGGGLALALLLKLREEGTALPAAGCLFSPWTDLALTGPSLEAHRQADPFILKEQLVPAAAWYLGGAAPDTPLASPLHGALHGLPPLTLYAGSTEVLLDDSRRLAQKAQAAGSPVRLHVAQDMPHVWPLFAPYLPEARATLAEAGALLRQQLGQAAPGRAA